MLQTWQLVQLCSMLALCCVLSHTASQHVDTHFHSSTKIPQAESIYRAHPCIGTYAIGQPAPFDRTSYLMSALLVALQEARACSKVSVSCQPHGSSTSYLLSGHLVASQEARARSTKSHNLSSIMCLIKLLTLCQHFLRHRWRHALVGHKVIVSL